MSSDFKAFVYGWGILIAFLVIRYLVRKKIHLAHQIKQELLTKLKVQDHLFLRDHVKHLNIYKNLLKHCHYRKVAHTMVSLVLMHQWLKYTASSKGKLKL